MKRYSTFIRRGASSLPVNRVWKTGFPYFWSKHTHTNFAFFWRLKNSCVFPHFPPFLFLIWENAALWLLPYTTCTVKVTFHGSEFPCPPNGGGEEGDLHFSSLHIRESGSFGRRRRGKILCGWHIRRRGREINWRWRDRREKLEVCQPEEGLSTIFPRNVPKNLLEKLEKSSFKAFLPFIVAISLLLVPIPLLFLAFPPPLFFRCPKPPLLHSSFPPGLSVPIFMQSMFIFGRWKRWVRIIRFFPSPYSYGCSPSFLGCIFLGFGSLNRGALKGGGKRHLLLRRSQKTCRGKT